MDQRELPVPFGKLLAVGQISSTESKIYACPNSQRAVIVNITYFNTHTGAVICETFFKAENVSRQFHKQSVAAGARLIVQDRNSPMYMDENQVLRAKASIGEVVNYFVWGYIKPRYEK